MTAQWYIVHAYSGFENKVAESIKQSAEEKGLDDLIEEIFVPSEDVTEVRRGRKIKTERRFFPGYVLVRIVLNEDSYHLIKNTARVTGFLGSAQKPAPVPQKEIDRIRGVVEEGEARPRPGITFDIGETVRVTDGPFASFSGIVEEVDEDATRLKVAVSIFGRATPVELEYTQVEKSK